MGTGLTPAEVVFRLIGPPEFVGGLLNLHEKSPYVWRQESKNRDAGDIPSAVHMRALLTHARANGIPLTPEHLIFGADAAEIEALVAQQKVAAE